MDVILLLSNKKHLPRALGKKVQVLKYINVNFTQFRVLIADCQSGKGEYKMTAGLKYYFEHEIVVSYIFDFAVSKTKLVISQILLHIVANPGCLILFG